MDLPRGRIARELTAHAMATHSPRMCTFWPAVITRVSRRIQLFLTSRGALRRDEARGGRPSVSVAVQGGMGGLPAGGNQRTRTVRAEAVTRSSEPALTWRRDRLRRVHGERVTCAAFP